MSIMKNLNNLFLLLFSIFLITGLTSIAQENDDLYFTKEDRIEVKYPEDDSVGAQPDYYGYKSNDYSDYYNIEISNDGDNWTSAYTEINGNGNNDIISDLSISCQFVRLTCNNLINDKYNLKEIYFYGTKSNINNYFYWVENFDEMPGTSRDAVAPGLEGGRL